jgi:O-antigen ligase
VLVAIGLLSGDTAVVGFLFPGAVLVEDPLYAFFEVRWLVLVFSVLPLGAILVQWSAQQRIAYNPAVVRAAVAVLVLVGYSAATAWWSSAEGSQVDRKLVGLALVGLYTVMVAMAVSGEWKATFEVWFWRTTAAVIGALALLGVVSLDGSMGRMAVLGGGPNIYGRLMGIGVYALLILEGPRRPRYLVILGIVLLVVMMVFSGSRGAMVSFALSGIVTLVLVRPSLRSISVVIPFVVAAGVGLYFMGFFDQLAAVADERLVKLLIERQHTAGRDVIYATAIEMGLSSFWFGTGLAGFTTAGMVYTYPHNLFLEFFSEGGILGLVVVAMTLFVCGRTVFRTSANKNLRALRIGLWVYLLTTSMFSGEFYDSRLIFILPLIGYGAVLVRGRAIRSSDPSPSLPALS